MPRNRFVVLGIVLSLAALHGPAWGDPPRGSRPLLIRDASWQDYRTRVLGDPRLEPLRKWVMAEADQLLNQPTLPRQLEGRRLLTTSRFVLMRVLVLGQAYHLTEDARYADRARAELLSAADFEDWNPSHFLDTAEMATALGIGLNWLGDRLSPEDQQKIRAALLDKCLRVSTPEQGFWNAENNWNAVCLTGVLHAALANAEQEPRLSAQMVERVGQHLRNGLKSYEPDGIPDEGPAYWSYGATYYAILFATLQTTAGERDNKSIPAVLLKSAEVRAMLDGPSGEWFGYSDNFGLNRLEPSMFFYAGVLNKPELLQSTWQQIGRFDDYLAEIRAGNPVRLWVLPLALCWAAPPETDRGATLPEAWSGKGRTPIALLRRGDPKVGPFVGVKGGSPSTSHAHMDIGSFVVDLDGVRWAMDLGAEDYGKVEAAIGGKLWDMSQDGQRWQLLRYHNLRHNTLSIAGQTQRISGKADIKRASSKPWPFAVLDLSPVYQGQAKRVTRGIRLTTDRELEVIDIISGVGKDDSVTWTWVTDADVIVESPRLVRLEKNGRKVWLIARASSDAAFEVEFVDDHRQPFESENPGVKAVRLVYRGVSDLTISVRLMLDSPADASQDKPLDDNPLRWGTPAPASLPN